jgi:hypothetical protein
MEHGAARPATLDLMGRAQRCGLTERTNHCWLWVKHVSSVHLFGDDCIGHVTRRFLAIRQQRAIASGAGTGGTGKRLGRWLRSTTRSTAATARWGVTVTERAIRTNGRTLIPCPKSRDGTPHWPLMPKLSTFDISIMTDFRSTISSTAIGGNYSQNLPIRNIRLRIGLASLCISNKALCIAYLVRLRMHSTRKADCFPSQCTQFVLGSRRVTTTIDGRINKEIHKQSFLTRPR